MRVLVCGGRDYSDWARLKESLDGLELGQISAIIHGAARGADALAERWAILRRVAIERFPADWKKLGPAAGPIRNKQMLVEGKPDIVIAFPGGRGTTDMVGRAKAAGIRVIEVGP